MVVKKTFLLVIVTILLNLTFFACAQTINDYILCGKERNLEFATKELYIYYPESRTSPATCKYIAKSPVGTFISATIYHNISGTEPTCAIQSVLVSRSGDFLMRDAAKFCGKRMTAPLQINSIGNEMAFELKSNTVSGTLQVVLKYVNITRTNCDCSWSSKTKIIAGTDTTPNEFVYHAAFKTISAIFSEAICGGTIISQNYVLTAAHCVMAIANEFAWRVTIEVGRYNITKNTAEDTIYSASYGIASAIVHNLYNSDTNANDIGLVKSSNYMRYSRGVGPACLAFSYQNFTVPNGNVLTAIGWGSTQYAMAADADKKSWILKKVTLTVNSTLPLCKNVPTKLCAAGVYNTITKQAGDSCQRDSGGGILGYVNNRFQTFGIISEGVACGAKDSYTSSTYVPKYLDWIARNIGNELLCVK